MSSKNKMHVVHFSGSISLLVQIVTTLIDSYVLAVPTNPKNNDIKSLLFIENWVNFIELCFYVWMVSRFKHITNITKYRYYDWFITTPTMLFTYSMYLLIQKKKEDNEPHDLLTLVKDQKYVLAGIMLLNWCMLFFGFMSETGKMGTNLAVSLGFIPFALMFYLIYENYAKYSQLGQSTFVYFVLVWGLYGVAALMAYKLKNTLYNILDVFSKNFFGLFLAYKVAFT
jgi:hypothetical protein